MNRVLSGEYIDAKIGLDGPHRCLYVKVGQEKILLTKGAVAQYALKSTLALSGDKIYVIRWEDGAVSTIRVEKPYEQFLIAGCESGAVSEDVAEKNRIGTVLAWILCLGIIVIGFIFVSKILETSQGGNPQSHSSSGRTWAEWDGKLKKPNADMLIQTTDTMGLTSNSGLASGYFINNSRTTYRHLEIIYEITDGVNKIGECTFSTDNVMLAPGKTQEFTAICDAWGRTPHIKISSVGFH